MNNKLDFACSTSLVYCKHLILFKKYDFVLEGIFNNVSSITLHQVDSIMLGLTGDQHLNFKHQRTVCCTAR